MKKTALVMASAMLTLVACGNKESKNRNALTGQREQARQGEQGRYRAVLNTLNSSVSGHPSGNAEIWVEGDEIKVQVEMNNLRPRAGGHPQHIHTATECPTMAADVNNDGFVDVIEGVPTYGPILVPLDGDLSSQAAQREDYPIASSMGSKADFGYVYQEVSSLSRLLADLRAPDENPDDAVVKLEADEDLDLAGRHIVIHGVPDSVNLPDSVATLGTEAREETLPIACGKIIRID